MSIQLLRNTRVFASTKLSGFTADDTWEILVGDDLQFSQDASSTDINPNEAGPVPVRGSKRFTDAVNPASWSFSTYILPATKDLKIVSPDAILWHSLASGSGYNPTIKEKGVFQSALNQIVSFKDSAHHELNKFNLFLLVDSVWYLLKGCQVGQAEIGIDIADIAKTAWSGNATDLAPLDTAPVGMLALGVSDADFLSYQNLYIKNKLTIMNLKDNNAGTVYDVAITGGTVTINNNITYLTPTTLSRVDRAIGSFTGALEVSGNLTCYVNTKANGSSTLWRALQAATASINSFDMALALGGKYADKQVPGLVIHMPKTMLEMPAVSSEDIISLTINFKGMGTDMDTGDEVRLCFGDKLDATRIDEFVTTGEITV